MRLATETVIAFDFRLMVEDLSYSMIQMLKRCRVEIELFHMTNGGSEYQSRDHKIMSRTLGSIPEYIDTALHRVEVMSPQAQQNWVSEVGIIGRRSRQLNLYYASGS
jgi:hypothetical protein